MKISNALIIRLGNFGLANTSEHDLPGDAAYIAFRFRRDAMKAYRELAERQKELQADTAGDTTRYDELNAELLKDTSEVRATPLYVRDYLTLAAENRRTPMPGDRDARVDFFHVFENDLEGILWADDNEAPKE